MLRSDPILRLLENWAVEAQLGEGVHTSVALVSCARTPQPFALKMYHRDRLSPELLQQVSKSRPSTQTCTVGYTATILDRMLIQVQREIRIHSFSQAPNVIPLYAAFEDEDGIYLLQQRAVSGDLFSHLAESGGFLFEEEARTVVRCLLNAVAALHERVSSFENREVASLVHSLVHKSCHVKCLNL